MADEDKKVEEEVNPQILEMKQAMGEMQKQMTQATDAMKEKDQEIKEMREASAKIAGDKLAKEKDLKAKLGVTAAPSVKTSEDINSLSNVDLLDIIAEAVESTIDAVKEDSENAVSENFKGLESKFDNLTQHIINTAASTELQKVRSENKDFDANQVEIKKILAEHQSFSIQDAYDWMKMKVAKGEIATQHIDSEKPDKDLSAADEAVVRVKKEPAGRKISNKRQFRSKLEEAIDKVQSRRGGN